MRLRYLVWILGVMALFLAGCGGNRETVRVVGGIPVACDLVQLEEFGSVLGLDTAVTIGSEYLDETGSGCGWLKEDGSTALSIGIWAHDGTASNQLDTMANPVDAVVTTEALPDIGDEAYMIDDGSGQAIMWREGERYFVMMSFVNIADREMVLEMVRLVDGRIAP
ncbi:MAG TPA: hypothetical protein ENJ93_01585 [Chloroflexi bacterium]|nr:hypothetical protein [Chloroflexota bacterium]